MRPVPTKKPSECLHFTIERMDEEEKAVLNLNGHGLLIPMLICKDCHTHFYIIESKPKKKG